MSVECLSARVPKCPGFQVPFFFGRTTLIRETIRAPGYTGTRARVL